MSKQEKPIQVKLKKKWKTCFWLFPSFWFFDRFPRAKNFFSVAIALIAAAMIFWIISIILPILVIAILAYFVYWYLKKILRLD